MLLAYSVYFFILIFVVGFAWLTIHSIQKYKFSLWKWNVMIPVLTISLLMGFRYDVGADWKAYLSYYVDILNCGISWQEIVDSTLEPLYWILNACIAFFNFPYQIFFAIIMFIHLILLYKSFDRSVFLLPLGLFFYFTTVFFTSLNIQRQTLAFCIFLYALRYVLNREFIKYAGCILIASLFHYSSIVLFPVYFLSLRWMKFWDSKYLMLILYVLSFLLFEYFLNIIITVLPLYITNTKYLQNMALLGNWNMDVDSGLGILATRCIDVLLILFSTILGRVYKNAHFNILFRIYFVGVCMANIFDVDVFLSRIPFAMVNLRFVVLAYFLYYLFHVKRSLLNYSLGGGVILLYMAMFIMKIYNGAAGCSPFQFG